MTEAEWAVCEPLLPAPAWLAGRGGRPATRCLRDIVDAIRYLTHNGPVWRDEEAAGSCEVCPGKALRECATCSLPLCRDVTSATLHERDMPQNAAKTCGQRAVKRS
jgi:hypothetical protein